MGAPSVCVCGGGGGGGGVETQLSPFPAKL